MATRIRDLLEALDHRAPFSTAAGWDAVGLQIGQMDASVGGVAVVHEITDSTAGLMVQAGLDTVVTYHPLVFRPLTSITDAPGPEGRALSLARGGINVVAVHTNWDVADGGTSDALAAVLGLDAVTSFGMPSEEGPEPQIGRIGAYPGSCDDLVSLVATELGGILRTAGMTTITPRRVAVLPGSGGSFIGAAVEQEADLLVSGDISHHDARSALDGGMAIIDPGHAATERPGVRALYDAVVEIAGAATDFTGIDNSPWEGG